MLNQLGISYSQTTELNDAYEVICDTIYEEVDALPVFEQSEAGLSQFHSTHLFPILSDYCTENDTIITTLTYKLYLSSLGQALHVEFQSDIKNRLQRRLRSKILNFMPFWKPAIKRDENVCCVFTIPIRCLKLE